MKDLDKQAQEEFEKYCQETKIPRVFIILIVVMFFLGGGIYIYECYKTGVL